MLAISPSQAEADTTSTRQLLTASVFSPRLRVSVSPCPRVGFFTASLPSPDLQVVQLLKEFYGRFRTPLVDYVRSNRDEEFSPDQIGRLGGEQGREQGNVLEVGNSGFVDCMLRVDYSADYHRCPVLG